MSSSGNPDPGRSVFIGRPADVAPSAAARLVRARKPLFRCGPPVIIGLVVLVSACSAESPSATVPSERSPAPRSFVGSQACAQCHAPEYERWQGSHHDLAMEQATPETVRGDFDTTSFAYAGVESKFSERDSHFFVTTDGPEGELVEYPIAYTFGVEPLQQYLIEFPDGRVQALSIVWDTRPAEAGGQRWFHLYPDERIDYKDVLHWTRPSQNWNFMCAECHSTGVTKNYDADEDRFSTTWNEIDVACEACHGPGSGHVAWAEDDASDEKGVGLASLDPGDDARWVMNSETGFARRDQPLASSVELETCARCHARRSMFSEDYVHGEPLMNTHRPALLSEGIYHADGQILDEVYVYGSYLQSAMHRAGVTCSDCHDSHSLQLKAPGNGVCAQCHLPEKFDAKTHHHHDDDSAASQCVACHMPSRTYMGVDARRDHSLRVPRPDLTAEIETPNACNGCHEDRSPEWAAAKLTAWFGAARAEREHYGEVLHVGRQGQAGVAPRLVKLAGDSNMPAIVRASALELLASNPHSSVPAALGRAARETDPLLRMAAAQSAAILPPAERVGVAGPLLSDPLRAVRLQAASTLIDVPRDAMLPAQLRALDVALDEYRAAQALNADRPESHLNMGVLYAAQGDLTAAVAAYQKAIDLRPEFVPPYINMADLYQRAGQEESVETMLRRGLAAAPDSADLHHVLGLSLVRQQRHSEALESLDRAHELAPASARFAYVLGIALHSGRNTERALKVLRDAYARRTGDRDILFALTTISRDTGDLEHALEYAEKIVELDPADPAAQQLLQTLSR